MVMKEEHLKELKVIDVVDKLWRRPVLVHEDDSIEDIVLKMSRCEYSRVAYVVDSDGRLKGQISLNMLMKAFYKRFRGRAISAVASSRLLRAYVAERAAELATKTVYYVRPEATLEEALHKMLSHNIKELPVVDEKKRVIAELWIIDLLKSLILARKRHKLAAIE